MGTQQQEEWKAIADSNGEYYISNQGRVKSHKFGKERILKPGLIGSGYQFVDLCFKGKKPTSRTIHKLVALAFIPNPENKPQVNHKDGDKLNNCIDNLEWVTRQENVRHAWENGLCESNRLASSKPVLDIITGKKYNSLISACNFISETYHSHAMRISKKSKLQRFFYL